MYCEFYQLRERPFNVTADPKFLYLNARYREALASLHYGISQRKGFITLIGEAGTGKTTLLKKLLDDLDSNNRTVFIFNTNVSFDEILEYIFGEFDLPIHNGKRLYMLATGTGIAPFASLVRDPDVYEAYEQVILCHTCRTNAELKYGADLVASLADDPLIGEVVGDKLKYFPSTTREDGRRTSKLCPCATRVTTSCTLGVCVRYLRRARSCSAGISRSSNTGTRCCAQQD